MKQNSENPFFGTYRTPFETPPFDRIETEHYEPAFDEGRGSPGHCQQYGTSNIRKYNRSART